MTMDERKLIVIERTVQDEAVEVEKPVKSSRATNPIAKKLMQFHHEKTGKFSVKDLFRP